MRRGEERMTPIMFVKTIHKSSLKNGGLFLLMAGAAMALLTWPQAVAGGVSRGLSICGTVIIPSLFPFLVLQHPRLFAL